MLRLLRVRNFALIDELTLEFGPGLNVLSGETGAGKSLIVDALALVGGAKASAEMIRSGEAKAIIEAVFDRPETLDLESMGLDAPGDADDGAESELVLRREISAGNRNRVFINSQPSSVAALRQIARRIVDIHGQHEQQSLLDPRRQLALVDRAVQRPELAERVRQLFHTLTRLESELGELDEAEAARSARLDLLEFQRAELERARPEPDEARTLRGRVRVLENSGRLLETAAHGYEALYEAEGSIVERLGSIANALRDAARIDAGLDRLAAETSAAISQVEEVAFALRDYAEGLDVDPGELDTAQARLAELERLHRKYGDDLVAHLETVIQELDTIGLAETRREQVSQQLSEAKRQYREAAAELGTMRRSVSESLARQVTGEIRTLAMPNAKFSIEWEAVDVPRSDGMDAVRFRLAANRGEAAGDLGAIASGGELSRAMLALRTVLKDSEEERSLVFDEVDAGIGGEAAEMVGRKLRGLSEFDQVLSVTHLAQIARFADRHLHIEKTVVGDRTVTRVRVLDDAGRIEELARMMSGPRVTETARRHVRELLERG